MKGGMGVAAAALLLLATCAALSLHWTPWGSVHQRQQLDAHTRARGPFGDELSEERAADRALPPQLRGEASERVHYMDSIKPRSDADPRWISACIAPGVDHTRANAHRAHHAAEPAQRISRAWAPGTGLAGSIAERLDRDPATNKHHYAGELEREDLADPVESYELDLSVEDELRSQGGHAHPHPHHRPEDGWTGAANPFGFKRTPHRNPNLACVYSPAFRARHARQCSSLLAAQSSDPSILASEIGRDGTLESPFKSVDFVLKQGKDTSCAAWGWFSDDLLTSGWNYLYVESNPTLDDQIQARALGFVEGALTVKPILEHRVNEMQTLFPPDGVIDALTKGFIDDMTTFNLAGVAAHAPADPYWQQIGVLYQQLQGVFDGYSVARNSTPSSELPPSVRDVSVTYFDLLLLQYDGDMTDVQAAVNPSLRVDPQDGLQRVMDDLIRNGHCSALIKLTDGGKASEGGAAPLAPHHSRHDAAHGAAKKSSRSEQELFVAHDTWAGFSSTHRMFKAYRLPLSNVSSSLLHFSSYPAFLSSTDDFYLTLETRLAVLETTNDIINSTLYNLVDSSTVPTWSRAMVATRLARGGNDWTGHFARLQSGTYNNQWMVLDYKLFTAGAPIVSNTLWIVEVMPGSAYSQDVSSILASQSYWASYNRPFFKPIYVGMGYASLNVTYGPFLFGYDRYFRAEIFRREQGAVKAVEDMQRVMSLNRWQTDVWSANNSGFAIAARFDLSTYDPVPSLGFFYRGAWGAYDVKITASAWMKNGAEDAVLLSSQGVSGEGAWGRHQPVGSLGGLASEVLRVSTINGPTHQDQVPFTWTDPEWANYALHVGLPDTYDFGFVQFHL